MHVAAAESETESTSTLTVSYTAEASQQPTTSSYIQDPGLFLIRCFLQVLTHSFPHCAHLSCVILLFSLFFPLADSCSVVHSFCACPVVSLPV